MAGDARQRWENLRRLRKHKHKRGTSALDQSLSKPVTHTY